MAVGFFGWFDTVDLTKPHEHDPDDGHDCEYRGMDMWACGHIDGMESCDCACCMGTCNSQVPAFGWCNNRRIWYDDAGPRDDP